MDALRNFIYYVKDRFRISTRCRQDACKERLDKIAMSHVVVCDGLDDDIPIDAIIADLETFFRCFPKVCVMQAPWLGTSTEVVEEMVELYKTYITEKPLMRFLSHAGCITMYADLKIGKADTSNFAFFNRRITQFLNNPYTKIASTLEACSAHGIMRWMTTPPPPDRDDQVPADIVNWDLTQTFFKVDFGGFDYVAAFDENFVETKRGTEMRNDFIK